MSEMIGNTRQWAKGRAVAASTSEPEKLDPVSNQAPKLKQEGENPFL